MSIHLDRIYTRFGDTGMTSLVGGTRISKASLRLETYGTVDELNSQMGLLRTHVELSSDPALRESAAALARVQDELFDLGSLIASEPGPAHAGMPTLSPSQVERLEHEIDAWNGSLTALTSFVLPGGNLPNAQAHIVRTVCRRAERLLIHMHHEEPVELVLIQYLNRLSDWLFVYSRWTSLRLGSPEYLWNPRRG
jgi:cob(I)alamin adenosyltransferase